MIAGCLAVVLGAFGGGLAGFWGCALAMFLGAGHAHDVDTSAVFYCGFVGTIVGGVTGPKLVASIARLLEARRVARINAGGKSPPWPLGAIACLGGSGVAALGAGTALFHGVAIAELPVENGGAVSTMDPVTRARLAIALAAVLFLAAAVLLVWAAKGLGRRPTCS
jgi:hypothetical protein